MSDVKYSIELSYFTSGNPARSIGEIGKMNGALTSASTGAGRSFDAAFGSMSKGVQSVTSTIGEGAALAFGAVAVAGAGALAAIGHGVATVNAQLEDMRIGMGMLFVGNRVTGDLTDGMQLASSLMTRMRKDAAALPGSFRDLTNIFSTTLSPALNAGMNVDRIRDLSSHAMAYGTAAGISSPVIGRELAALISGNARGSNLLGSRLPGLALHGDEARKFNGLSATQRVGVLEQSLGMRGGSEAKAYDQALTAYSKSWTGVMTSLRDTARTSLGTATEPLFERIKSALGSINEWLGANGDRVRGWAEQVGKALAHGFDLALGYLKLLEPSLVRLGGFLQHQQAKGLLQRDAALAGGAVVGGAALASAAPTVLSTLGSVGGLLAKISETQPEIGLAAVVALTSAMVPLGAIALATGGVLEALSDDLDVWHVAMTDAVSGIKEDFAKTIYFATDAWGKLATPLENISSIAGLVLVNALDLAVRGLTGFMQAVSSVADELKPWLDYTGLNDRLGAPAKERGDRLYDPGRDYHDSVERKGPTVQNHTTHVTNHVQMHVVGNTDPNRIAKAVFHKIGDLSKNPRVVPSTQTQFHR